MMVSNHYGFLGLLHALWNNHNFRRFGITCVVLYFVDTPHSVSHTHRLKNGVR